MRSCDIIEIEDQEEDLVIENEQRERESFAVDQILRILKA